jgi:hypothetical protein
MKKLILFLFLIASTATGMNKEPYITAQKVFIAAAHGSKTYEDFKMIDISKKYFIAAGVGGLTLSVAAPLLYQGLKKKFPNFTKEFSNKIKSAIALAIIPNALYRGWTGSFKILNFFQEQSVMRQNPKYFTQSTIDEHSSAWPSLLIDPALAFGSGFLACMLIENNDNNSITDKENCK